MKCLRLRARQCRSVGLAGLKFSTPLVAERVQSNHTADYLLDLPIVRLLPGE